MSWFCVHFFNIAPEYIEEGEEMERASKPKAKNEEKEPGKEQNQAEQPQDSQSV